MTTQPIHNDAAAMGQQLPNYALHNPVHADARNRVIDRLLEMNSLHALRAWDLRRLDPLGPHGLAFHYADLGPKPAHAAEPDTGWSLRTATRLWLDGEREADLPGLLMRLVAQAEELGEDFDPRVQMSNRFEPMARTASYLGLGVSSLDTDTGAWYDVMGTVSGVLNIPGRCYAVFWDGARVVVDRRGENEYRAVRVRSSANLGNLGTQFGVHQRRWAHDPGLDHVDSPMWRFMDQLNKLALIAHRRPEE